MLLQRPAAPATGARDSRGGGVSSCGDSTMVRFFENNRIRVLRRGERSGRRRLVNNTRRSAIAVRVTLSERARARGSFKIKIKKKTVGERREIIQTE